MEFPACDSNYRCAASALNVPRIGSGTSPGPTLEALERSVLSIASQQTTPVGIDSAPELRRHRRSCCKR